MYPSGSASVTARSRQASAAGISRRAWYASARRIRISMTRPVLPPASAAGQALRLVEQVQRAAQIPFGLADPGHRDPPAIPVLRQPGVLAQFLASQQVLRGGPQLVALAVDLAHPHVHVSGSPQDRAARLGGTLQGLLVRAHRRTETTLGDPDVGQRYRAAEDIGDMPGPP